MTAVVMFERLDSQNLNDFPIFQIAAIVALFVAYISNFPLSHLHVAHASNCDVCRCLNLKMAAIVLRFFALHEDMQFFVVWGQRSRNLVIRRNVYYIW